MKSLETQKEKSKCTSVLVTFSVALIKFPDERGERVISMHRSRVWSFLKRQAWLQSLAMSVHNASKVRKQKLMNARPEPSKGYHTLFYLRGMAGG